MNNVAMNKLDIVFQMSEKAFLAEQERAKNLTEKSEKYISAIAVVVGFQLLDISSLNLTNKGNCYDWLAVIGLVMLGFAFLTAFTSNGIYVYHSYPASDKYRSVLEDKQVDEMSAKAAFLKMYMELLDINIPLNNNRAEFLSISANLITIGFILIVVRYVLEMIAK